MPNCRADFHWFLHRVRHVKTIQQAAEIRLESPTGLAGRDREFLKSDFFFNFPKLKLFIVCFFATFFCQIQVFKLNYLSDRQKPLDLCTPVPVPTFH
jgi:hypothetical protein